MSNEYKDWLRDQELEDTNMKEYWQIIPKGDGYTYIGYKDGEYIKCSKADDHLDTSLIFEHKSNCEKYLRNHLDTDKYEVEMLLLDPKYYELEDKDLDSRYE